MLKRIFVALVLACLSLHGCVNAHSHTYRDEDCHECEEYDDDWYVSYLVKHAGHSHSLKKPKNYKKYRSPSPSPSESDTGTDVDGDTTDENKGDADGTGDDQPTPGDNADADTEIIVLIPEFQLDFTLFDAVRRRLRIPPVNGERKLQSALESEIYNLVHTYMIENAENPWPTEVHLRQNAATIGSETSSNIISTFMGYILLREYSDDITVDDNQGMMMKIFEENKDQFIKSVNKSELDAMRRVEDVTFSFTGKEGDSSGYAGDGWFDNRDENVIDIDSDRGTGPSDPEDVVNDSEKEVTVLKATNNTAFIAGALAGFAVVTMFAYAYRKHSKDEKEYELTGDFEETFEGDLDAKGCPRGDKGEMMRSMGIWNGTNLGGIAAAGPVRSGFSYLGAAAKSWTARGSSMSDLAAGATQEEFAENGMKVHIYGSCQKEKQPSKKRTQKVNMMLKKNSPRGGELSTALESIVEVDSAVSGDSSAKSTESWQQGNKDINNAPPLLPAMSVSSAPSDETPLNDMYHFSHGDALAPPSSGTPDYNISFNTPLATPPHDSMNMECMTPYGDMSGLSGSPNMTQQSNSVEETPLKMKCLNFNDDSELSDFSSDKSDKSRNSCLKDMIEAINPNNSDSSSDGCVKDMLADIDDCAIESLSDISLSGSISGSESGKEREDAQLALDFVEDFAGADKSAAEDIEESEMDQSICPPEVHVDSGKMVITDEVSGKSESVIKIKDEPSDNAVEEDNYDDVPLVGEVSDNESDSISLITIDQFNTKEQIRLVFAGVTHEDLDFSANILKSLEPVASLCFDKETMNAREQLHITETLAALQARGDHFTRQLLQEKQRVSQLEGSLSDLTEEISNVRSENKRKAIGLLNKHTTTTKNAYQRVDGLDPTRLAEINQKKLVSNLEGRLNKALVRQCSIESENNIIKEKIDKLRRKVANDGINRKEMEKQLKHIQDGVDIVMKRAAGASEQSDKIMILHDQLVKENLNERGKFNEKYMEMTKYIDEQNQLLGSSIAQVASDVENKLQSVDAMQSLHTNADHLNPVDEMKALDVRLIELERQVNANTESLKQEEEKNKSYTESFKRLHQASGLECTDDIIKAFIQNEEESFSMFNYIQTVNQECDKLLEERMKLEREIGSFRQELDQKETDRKLVVDGHNKRIAEARKEKEKLQEANRDRKMTVLKIANNVQGLYIKLKCRLLENDSSPKDLAATIKRASSERKITMFAGEQISEQNIMRHVELIERRAIEIIAEYARSLDGKTRGIQRRPSALLSPKSFDRTNTAHTHTSKDSYVTSDEDDSDDEGSGLGRPVSVHDMRRAAAEKMKKPVTPNHNKSSHSVNDFFQ